MKNIYNFLILFPDRASVLLGELSLREKNPNKFLLLEVVVVVVIYVASFFIFSIQVTLSLLKLKFYYFISLTNTHTFKHLTSTIISQRLPMETTQPLYNCQLFFPFCIFGSRVKSFNNYSSLKFCYCKTLLKNYFHILF